MDKKTKIICTMGPATEDEGTIRGLIEAGMNVARFNFSHGTHEYHEALIAKVRSVASELGVPVAIMLDTKGPEIRTGLLKGHAEVELAAGSRLTLTPDMSVEGDASAVAVDYEPLRHELSAGDTVLVDDGLIELRVDSTSDDGVSCTVVNGGMLGEQKGVNVPGVRIGLPSVTERDEADIRFGCELGIDAVAASFVRDADAVDEIRGICVDCGRPDVQIISKIENSFGVGNFDGILAASDGVMVARGDLGVEVPTEQIPHIQKRIIAKCNAAHKPVITATQMLESMIHNPRPTRAEVNDVANAIYDGTDCVMLSGETASGEYPVETVRMMADICRDTEGFLPERHEFPPREGVRNVGSAIGHASVELADQAGARCIICPTRSGRTARLVSTFRPDLPIYAISAHDETLRRCCFLWGVEALKTIERGTVTDMIYGALTLCRERGVVSPGDVVVVTAGDPQTSPRQGDYTTPTNIALIAQVQ